MQFEREIIETFLLELEECLLRAEDAVIALESRPDDAELPQVLLRTIHTVKGDAGSLGFARFAAVAHGLEDLLEELCRGRLAPESALITLVLEAIDWLGRSGNEVRATGADTSIESQALLDQLKQIGHRGQASALSALPSAAGVGASRGPLADSISAEAAGIAGARGTAGTAGTMGAAAVTLRRGRTLRVQVDKLDGALDAVSEIAVAIERLPALRAATGQVLPEDLIEAHQSLLRLSRDLQDRMLALRMVPVGPTLRGFIRTVRDVAGTLGKQSRLVIEGGEVTVDANVIEQLREPLLHLIRNALDHGIELPNRRKLSGKAPCGTITVRARRDAGTFVVQVADDGAGLSRRRIAARARAQGLLAPSRARADELADERAADAALDKLSDAELFALVFVPGFSTAEQVTDLSGRGVGMNVVKQVVESLHGSVELASQEDVGTTITLRLPVSSALMEAFALGLEDDVFFLPREAVYECLEFPAAERPRSTGVLQLRGRPLPFICLRELLGGERRPQQQESIVVIEWNGQQLGLAVEKLYGETRVVVKPMSAVFRSVRVLSGCTVLGSGRIGLILDVAGLFREAQGFRAARPLSAAAAGGRA